MPRSLDLLSHSEPEDDRKDDAVQLPRVSEAVDVGGGFSRAVSLSVFIGRRSNNVCSVAVYAPSWADAMERACVSVCGVGSIKTSDALSTHALPWCVFTHNIR